MKILAIRVKNLASLEGVSEIDFTKEPLSSSGIFAITGPTGAGKSTLLDALCLALYSKTPRYIQAKESGIDIQDVTGSKISQGDIRGILRDGTSEGFAEVDFVGVDGIKYRVNWSVRRARNKVDGSLQADSIELTNLSTNIPIPGRKTEVLKEIERLVGLNFEQFTRSVLLAQGDFTAFLKADKDSKSSLLEKLTGTDVYSAISRLIYEKFKQAEQEVRDLQGQISGIVILNAAELESFNLQKVELKKTIKGIEDQSNTLSTEISWHHTLAELIDKRDKGEVDLKTAQSSKHNAGEKIKIFEKVESIQPARKLVDFKTNTESLLQLKNIDLHELVGKIAGLNESHEAEVKKLKEADNILLEKQNESNVAEPSLAEAKKLDILIIEKKGQFAEAENEAVNAEQKKKDHFLLVEKKESELKDQSGKIQGLEKWQDENISKAPIAENISLITSKLADAGKLISRRDILVNDNQAISSNFKESYSSLEELEKKASGLEKTRGDLNKDFEEKKNELSVIPIETLRNEESVLIPSIEETISAKGNWELLFAAQKEQKEINDKLVQFRKDIKSNSTDLKEKLTLRQEALIKKQQTEKLLSNARLQVAENVEDLRSQLADNEECPVCGSKEHPFSIDNPQLHKVLEGLEKEFSECNKTYEQLLTDTSGLEIKGQNLAASCDTFEEDLKIMSGNIESLEINWQSSKTDPSCFHLAPEERLVWLDSAIDKLRSRLKEIQPIIKSYTEIRNGIDRQKEQIDLREKELNLIKQVIKYNSDISEITTLLNHYFVEPEWINNWERDSSIFETNIKSFSKTWNDTVKKIDGDSQNLNIMKKVFIGLQGQLNEFESDANGKEKKRLEKQRDVESEVKKRTAIFNGEEVAKIEQGLKKAIEDAIAAQTGIKTIKDRLNGELITAIGNKNQLDLDISGFNRTIEKYSAEIKSWISEYNSKFPEPLNEETLVLLLSYTPEWIDTERNAITSINDRITKAMATFEERANQVLEHEKKKTSIRALEELTELNAELKSAIDLKAKEKNEIDFKLKQDQENKNKASSLLKQIELKNAIYENWSKLNDLIGSADGKKFRQIAQEYTLDMLLDFANIHLLGLSHRYKLLRVPGSLGLQVLDKDMGDELRTVHSLSGGESFLVSLALALGLASLSSDKMKVESLFIDEGFGSLDPSTLNIAMDALERLHNQGRKVGVISHVQEMTERIQTQIKVSKLSNGRSKVEVISTAY